MTIETRPFDPAAYLDSPEAILAYLDGAFADGDASEIADALAWSPALAACLNSPRKPA